MVSKRQKLARKRYKEAHPELFPQKEPTAPNPDKKKFPKKNKFKRSKTDDESTQKRKSSSLRKHPLRVPGMKPGECCFICKAQDHIAKLCPKKSMWEKNKICLLCRQRGHTLKSCPNKGGENDKKYCYNCGESGHSLSKCPHPIQEGGTKFASCFVCNERGHLSKNCPNNTRGIYPKGGCCKVCGEITHLAKYCPDKGKKKADTASRPERDHTTSEGEDGRRHQVTFQSGDDLEDDFMVEEGKAVSKEAISNKDLEQASKIHGRKNTSVTPKKKQGPTVVNFFG